MHDGYRIGAVAENFPLKRAEVSDRGLFKISFNFGCKLREVVDGGSKQLHNFFANKIFFVFVQLAIKYGGSKITYILLHCICGYTVNGHLASPL